MSGMKGIRASMRMAENYQQALSGANLHVTLRNGLGSVEHYFHFLLGFFVPLFMARDGLVTGNSDRLLVRSCAVLDRHLRALAWPDLVILEREVHEKMKLEGLGEGDFDPLQFVEIEGRDSPERYSSSEFQAFSSRLKKHLYKEFDEARSNLKCRFGESGRRVLLINRGEPMAYYNSNLSEIKTSGNQRRSIPNFDDLADALAMRGVNVLVEYLDDASLVHQMALFDYADVVIAQHGAALTNLVFCSKTMRVIEILPRDQSCRPGGALFFSLAGCMGHEYKVIWQEDAHSIVDESHLLKALE
jgi:hypothetical protein